MHAARLVMIALVGLGCASNAPEAQLTSGEATATLGRQDSEGAGTPTGQTVLQTDTTSDASDDTETDPQTGVPGGEADSCGEPGPGLEPADCTEGGDSGAACVYGHHCLCSEGYVCDGASLFGENDFECAPGVGCIPAAEPANVGTEPASCGDPIQGLEPMDCTAGGDSGSACVYGNHCLCSEGFVCDGASLLGNNNYECAPGVGCVEESVPGIVGAEATSCGAPSQGLEPINCTVGGDTDAVCVFSNHCMCSEGYICDGPVLAGSECEAGVGCVLAE